jgi:ABC-type Fe3+ transport system permease subunit
MAAYVAPAAYLAVHARLPAGARPPFSISWVLSWTVLQAALAASIAVALGWPLGVLAGFYAFKPASALRVAGLPVFMAPSVAIVLGFRGVYRGLLGGTPLRILATGPIGVVAVHSYFNIPLATVLTAAAAAEAPPEAIEYFTSIGLRGPRLWLRALMPLTAPGAVAAWLLTFTYSFMGLAAPLMIPGAAYRYYTLEAWIYTLYSGFPTLRGLAAWAAVLQLATLTVVAVVFAAAHSRLPAMESYGGAYGAISLRGAPRLAAWAYSILVYLYLFAPLAGVFAASLVDPSTGRLSLDAYVLLAHGEAPLPPGASLAGAVANSLAYAAASSAIALLAAALATPVSGALLRASLLAPLAVSPVVAGLGLYLALMRPLEVAVGLEWASRILIVVAHSAMALPLAARSLETGLARVPREAVEFAASIGLRGARLALELARASGDALLAGGLLAAASSLGEFGGVLVLSVPETWSLGVLTYRLYGAGRVPHLAAASATLLLTLTFTLSAMVARRVRRWL